MTTPALNRPNIEALQQIYADLTLLGQFADDRVVLHAADGQSTITGRAAVVGKEHELIDRTHGTLRMDVDDIIANDHFGAVLGTLRARRDHNPIAMPFCGLWRFDQGRIVEHWENAYDPAALGRFLAG